MTTTARTTPDTGPEWRPDDELTHTPPPTASRGLPKPRLVQRPKKGESVTGLVCQWCGRPVPADRAAWWDERPQCPDAWRCTEAVRRSLAAR